MLSLEQLEKVRHVPGGKLTARCPACHEAGGDRTGTHLVYWPDTERFACAANPGDKAHRQRIWQLAGKPDPGPRERRLHTSRRSPAARVRFHREQAREARRAALPAAACAQVDRILQFSWDPVDIWHESGVILDGMEPDWHLLLSTLHPSDAVLWTGSVHHSGPGHERHFQPWPALLESHPDGPPGPMTCPSTFHPGSCRRDAASLAASPYVVVEADEAIGYKPATPAERALNVARNLAILRWLRDEAGWNLRAIVHTGGKSCHGWFDRPPDPYLEELRAIAPALGIDAGVFSPTHPVRLPGVIHEKTGHLSRLLYLTV